jgi:hypothetical protein
MFCITVFTALLGSVFQWCDILSLCVQRLLSSLAVLTRFQLLNSLTVGWSVKLLLAFTSTVIPGFNLPEIHGQDFYSLLDMRMI